MRRCFHLGLATSLLALPVQLWAGGLSLYEIGTDNTGLANAGSAARAQGPSTIASNPAGMSYLAGTQISAGAQILFGDLTFSRDSATTTAGSGSGNVLDPIPGGSFFISHQLDDQWSFGFGSYGDFGLAVNYDNDWSGRYFVQSASIAGLSLVPSVAYRFNEQWSVGVGLKAMYGMLESEAAIDQWPIHVQGRHLGVRGQCRGDLCAPSRHPHRSGLHQSGQPGLRRPFGCASQQPVGKPARWSQYQA